MPRPKDLKKKKKKESFQGELPSGPAVKNLPVSAGDPSSVLGPGRFPHALRQLSPCVTTPEACVPRIHALQQEKPVKQEAHAPQLEKSPHAATKTAEPKIKISK